MARFLNKLIVTVYNIGPGLHRKNSSQSLLLVARNLSNSSSGSSSSGSSFDEDVSGKERPEPSSEPYNMYHHHIPTSTFQKYLLSIGAAAMAISNPWRGDMVATLGETSGYFAIKYMQNKMNADPEGRQILEEQPRINSSTVDLNYLKGLPIGTLGKEYSTWLEKHHASPDERSPVKFVDDPELAYVMTRYREVHDLFHTVLGMPTNMLGEVTVKWVEAIQTGLPMCALGAIFGPVRLGPKHRQKYITSHLKWAIETGLKSRNLMCVYYEHYWEEAIEDLRIEWNIPQPPHTPTKKGSQYDK